MSRKNIPSVRFRQQLQDAVAGGGESFSGYVRLAAQAMLQTAMEAEAAEFIGRAGYQRRGEEQSVCARVVSSSSNTAIATPMRWRAWRRAWKSA